MKKMTAILIISLLVLSLVGCNGNSSAISTKPAGSSEVNSTPAGSDTQSTPAATSEPSEVTIEEAPDYTELYATYLEAYRAYQWDIAAYDWSWGDGPVAICDIVGDTAPEMLYVTAFSETEAYLHIYQYENGEANRIYYETIDIQAGGGTYYCLFTTTDGRTILYERSAGFPKTYSFKELVLANGILVIDTVFQYDSAPSEDHTTFTNTYFLDGAEISESEYLKLESDAVGKMKDVVIWSCLEDDGPVWEKISAIGTSAAMSAEEAIQYLVDMAGDKAAPASIGAPDAGASGSFNQDVAISYLTESIINGWGQYLDEEDIPDVVTFSVIASDRLYDAESIYLIGYTVGDYGRGKSLVFVDGTTMSEFAVEYPNYSGYFETVDITADWPFN